MVTEATPARIIAGDTAQWQKTFSDYPASAGWALKYSLVKAGNKYDIDGTAAGDDFLMTATAATTAAWAKGSYKYQARMTKGSEAHTVEQGNIEIVANYSTAAGGLDDRTHARKVLDAIEAVIENRATMDQQEYQIGDRMLKRTDLADLYKLRSQYKALVANEEKLANAGSGKPSRRRTLIRMP